MALPSDNTRAVSPPQRWRLSIGETVAMGDGRTRPQKLDYFTIRRLTYQRGQAPMYVVDPEMQALLEQAAGCTGREKPKRIPVQVIGNASMRDGKPYLPESILFSELAWYGGGRTLCSCGEWDEDGIGQAIRPVYKTRGAGDKVSHYRDGEQTVVCDPRTCPYRLGTHDLPKAKGTPVCKPHVILSVVLPWWPSVGGTAKLKTTGWNSYYGMRDSLLQIASNTGGWLHGLPLWLVFEWKTSGGNMVPYLQFEVEGTQLALRDTVLDVQRLWVGQENELRQLQAGVVEDTRLLLSSREEQVATNREFYPETAEVDAAPKARRVVVPSVVSATTEEPEPQQDEQETPLFDEAPADLSAIRDKFDGLDERGRFVKLLRFGTNQVLGRPLNELPAPSAYENPDQEQELLRVMHGLAEEWWDRHGGREAHEEEPEAVAAEAGEPE